MAQDTLIDTRFRFTNNWSVRRMGAGTNGSSEPTGGIHDGNDDGESSNHRTSFGVSPKLRSFRSARYYSAAGRSQSRRTVNSLIRSRCRNYGANQRLITIVISLTALMLAMVYILWNM